MLKRILVPLDGTAQSNAALPLARTLARATGGSIALLRVVSPGDSSASVTAQRLDQIADELAQSGVEVSAATRESDTPADEILRQATDLGADVIVMRTHGRAGIGRTVMGSVTQNVLAAAQIPVMLMRPGGRRISQFRRLLVPVDGSPGGAIALATAIAMARTSGAAIDLVQAVVPIPMQAWVGYSGPMSYYDPEWDEEARVSAQGYVTSIATRVRATGLEVTAKVVEGPSVPDLIVDAADAAGADAIVMSTHALTGVARALLGSVADAVVRQAHCPVLMVRRVESEAESVDSRVPVVTVSC